MRQENLATLQARLPGTLMEQLGMQFVGIGPDWISARMPIDARTKQIHGVLHGGASAALIESLGSIGAALSVEADGVRCVGVEVNANHVRSAGAGWVVGTARPLHLGRTLQVWRVDIVDEQKRLVSTGRLTVAVLKP